MFFRCVFLVFVILIRLIKVDFFVNSIFFIINKGRGKKGRKGRREGGRKGGL